MNRTMATEVDIPAPIEDVWSVLVDDRSLERWLPLVVSRGRDDRLEISAPVPRTHRADLRVNAVHEPHVVQWRIAGAADRLLVTEHRFRLSPLGRDWTRVAHDHESRGAFSLLPGARRRRELRHRAIDYQLRNRAQWLRAMSSRGQPVIHARRAAAALP